MTITTTSGTITSGATASCARSFDHRTSSTRRGEPANHYRRVERPTRRPVATPDYRVRRLGAAIVAIAAVFVMATLLNGLLVSFGGSPAAAAEATPAGSGVERSTAHVARPGDTMWSIADEHRGSVSRERYVQALIALNGSTAIEVGQAVHLP